MTARRLLSVAHSYCVGVNRRLAHEIARAGRDAWEVVAVAPTSFRGDLRPIRFRLEASEPCRVETVPVHLSGLLHLMFYGRRLRDIIRRGWDLVHCWEEPYVVAGWQVGRWTAPTTPFVFWTAQNISKQYPVPFSWMERWCVERSAGWLACGTSTEEALVARGYGLRRHAVVPLGVDVLRLRRDAAARRITRERLGWSDDGAPVIGYLGRLVPEKGVGLLMNVCDRLETSWRALIAGTGPLEAAMRRWADQHGDRVRLLTDVGHDEVGEVLNAMDVLCVPSQTTPRWREQFGRVVIEAFACGVPVIGSDSGEIPYVVRDAGLLIGERDVEGWTRGLADLLESPARRADLAARGLDRASTVYAWPIIARRHLEFFEQCLT